MRYITPHNVPYVSSFVGGINPELLLKAGAEYQNRYDLTEGELAKLTALGMPTPGIYKKSVAKELASEVEGYRAGAREALLKGDLSLAKQNIFKEYGLRGSADWKSVEEDAKKSAVLEEQRKALEGAAFTTMAPGSYDYKTNSYADYGKGQAVPEGAYDLVSDIKFMDQALALGKLVSNQTTSTVMSEAVPMVDSAGNPVLDPTTGQQRYSMGQFTGTIDDLSKPRFEAAFAENIKAMEPDLSKSSSFTALGFRNNREDYYAGLSAKPDPNRKYGFSERQERFYNDLLEANAGLMRTNTVTKEQQKPMPVVKPGKTGEVEQTKTQAILTDAISPLPGNAQATILTEVAKDDSDDNITQVETALTNLENLQVPNAKYSTGQPITTNTLLETYTNSDGAIAKTENILSKASANDLTSSDLQYLDIIYKGMPPIQQLQSFKEDMNVAMESRDIHNMVSTVKEETYNKYRNDPAFKDNFNDEGKLKNFVTNEQVLDLQYKNAKFPVKGSTIGMSKKEVVEKYGYNEGDFSKDYEKLVQETNPAFGKINKDLQENLGKTQRFVKSSIVINDFIETNGGTMDARNLKEKLNSMLLMQGKGGIDLTGFLNGDKFTFDNDKKAYKLQDGSYVKALAYDPISLYPDVEDGDWKVYGELKNMEDSNNPATLGAYSSNVSNVAPGLITPDLKAVGKLYSKIHKQTASTESPVTITTNGKTFPIQKIGENAVVIMIGGQAIQCTPLEAAGYAYYGSQSLETEQSGGTGGGKPQVGAKQ